MNVRYLLKYVQMAEKTKLEDHLRRNFHVADGNFFPCLDKSLQYLNVKRQAYHGGTFVGNHVHKLLKVKHNEYSYNTFMYNSVNSHFL